MLLLSDRCLTASSILQYINIITITASSSISISIMTNILLLLLVLLFVCLDVYQRNIDENILKFSYIFIFFHKLSNIFRNCQKVSEILKNIIASPGAARPAGEGAPGLLGGGAVVVINIVFTVIIVSINCIICYN